MPTVLVFGTFDAIHPGHLSFLRQARSHGTKLVASIARDTFVVAHKRRRPLHSEEERRRAILATGLVDEAYLGDEVPGTYSRLVELEPDVVCVGYDQREFLDDISRWLDEHLPDTRVVVLDPYEPERFKSSKLNSYEG